jgi:uncharacterized protein (DUF1810 family)
MYELDRFVQAQAPAWPRVVAELKAGRKTSHWIWYVFPQLKELGRSHLAVLYGIGSLAEAMAYLEHPLLGERLRECVRLLIAIEGSTAHQILGSPDDLKVRSCLTLFAAAGGGKLFEAALEKFYDGQPDERTVELLATKARDGGSP